MASENTQISQDCPLAQVPPTSQDPQPLENVEVSQLNADCKSLSLPVEVFEPILLQVYQEVDLPEAWKLRSVCKTFRSYIEEEVLTNRPLTEFGKQDRAIIYENLEKVLVKRCFSSPKNLQKNALPCLLVRLADELVRAFPPEEHHEALDEVRKAYVLDLIRLQLPGGFKGQRAVGTTCLGLDWICLNRMRRYDFDLMTSELRDVDIVIAAASVGNIAAVQFYLEKNIDLLDEAPFLSAGLLETAVKNDKHQVIASILERFESVQEEKPSWYSREVYSDRYYYYGSRNKNNNKVLWSLERAISEAMSKPDAGILHTLLGFEVEHYDYSVSRLQELLEDVTEDGTLQALEAVCSYKKKDQNFATYESTRWWKKVCFGGKLDMISYLVKHDIVSLGLQDVNCRPLETPLKWVAEEGQAAVVTLLAELGADLNYCKYDDGFLPSPLQTAAYSGNTEVLEALIKAGANVHNGTPLTAVFNCDRRSYKNMYSCARLLIENGSPVNRRVAWDIEKDAMWTVTSGQRWVDGDVSSELVMGIILVCQTIKQNVPRWKLPYADFWTPPKHGRQSFYERGLATYCFKRLKTNKCTPKHWPDMYFTSRVLRKVAHGNLKNCLPDDERERMVVTAKDVWKWLEDRRN